MTGDLSSPEDKRVPQIPPYPLPDERVTHANRVSWTLEHSRCALLVHDMQNYWINRFLDPTLLLANCASLLEACRRAGIPIFYSIARRESQPQDRGLALEMWGAGIGVGSGDRHDDRIVEVLAPRAGDAVVEKRKYSAFFETNFAAQLDVLGVSQLIVTGVYAHHGCFLTAADAFMRDIEVFFAVDATADHSEEEHLMTCRLVPTMCGQNMTSQQLIAALGS